MKYNDMSTSLHGRCFSRIEDRHTSSGPYLDGEVLTPQGIVVILQENDRRLPFTRLDFCYRGRLHNSRPAATGYEGGATRNKSVHRGMGS